MWNDSLIRFKHKKTSWICRGLEKDHWHLVSRRQILWVTHHSTWSPQGICISVYYVEWSSCSAISRFLRFISTFGLPTVPLRVPPVPAWCAERHKRLFLFKTLGTEPEQPSSHLKIDGMIVSTLEYEHDLWYELTDYSVCIDAMI